MKNNQTGFVKFFFVAVIFCALITYFFLKNRTPLFEGLVKIEEIKSFEGIEGWLKIFKDDKENLYTVMSKIDGSGSEYYLIQDVKVIRIDSIPESLTEVYSGSVSDFSEHTKTGKYQMNILYKSDLSCDAEIKFVDNGTTTSILINGKVKTHCLRLYGNDSNKSFATRAGNVYGSISTKVYWLENNKAFYVKNSELENFRNPNFIYVKKGDYWYVLTSSYVERSQAFLHKLYKLDFEKK